MISSSPGRSRELLGRGRAGRAVHVSGPPSAGPRAARSDRARARAAGAGQRDSPCAAGAPELRVHEDAAEVGMAGEADAEHVERLALAPSCALFHSAAGAGARRVAPRRPGPSRAADGARRASRAGRRPRSAAPGRGSRPRSGRSSRSKRSSGSSRSVRSAVEQRGRAASDHDRLAAAHLRRAAAARPAAARIARDAASCDRLGRQSHSSAPLRHTYTRPSARTATKIAISTKPNKPSVRKSDRPRIEEHDLDVEHDEEDRGQIELDREAAPRRSARRVAALERLALHRPTASADRAARSRSEEHAGHDHGEPRGHEDRDVGHDTRPFAARMT